MLFSAAALSLATAEVFLAETAIAVSPVTVVLPLMPAIAFLATALSRATAEVFSAEAAIAVLPVTVVRLPLVTVVRLPEEAGRLGRLGGGLTTLALTPPGSAAKASPETATMETANRILRILTPH
jgi:hypothetical protein